MKLDELVTQLREAYGTALRSVVLYGSAASAEHDAARSDYNVLVVASEIPLGRLKELSAVTRAWRDAGNHPPMTFTESEWRGSADVFPMEYADILERHRVLWGAAPFDGIEVNRQYLRLQLEHEARGVLLRLRGAVLAAGADAADQTKLLSASLSSLLIVFRGLLRFHGRVPGASHSDVVRQTAEATGVDLGPVGEVARQGKGGAAVPKERAGDLLVAYLRCMEAVVAHIDALPEAA